LNAAGGVRPDGDLLNTVLVRDGKTPLPAGVLRDGGGGYSSGLALTNGSAVYVPKGSSTLPSRRTPPSGHKWFGLP
jgi:hypothetical protein